MNKITLKNGKIVVPNEVVIPFIEGDGTGADIWASSVRVLDAAVKIAYNEKEKLLGKRYQPEKKHLIKPEIGIAIDHENITSVFIEINGNLIPFFIEKNKSKNNSVVFQLDSIDRDATIELIGCKVYVPQPDDVLEKEGSFQELEIIGFKVIDTSYGDIGIIETILQLPQQQLIQV